MSLYRKLVLFMLVVTVVPVSVVGFALERRAEGALRDRIRDSQASLVRSEADAVAGFVTDRVDALRRATTYFDLSTASADELEGAARVLYKASPEVSATAIVSPKGAALAPPVHLDDPAKVPGLSAHPAATEAAVQRMLAFAPLDRAEAEGPGSVVLSPPYSAPERKAAAFSAALPVEGKDHAERIFVAEISLGSLQRRVAAHHGDRLLVVDGGGRAVIDPDVAELRRTVATPAVRRALAAGKAGTSREGGARGPVLAAWAPVPVPGLQWTVVATLPEATAFAPVRRMRLGILGATAGAGVLLLLLGGVFVGSVRRGLGRVSAGAEAFAKGELGYRIDPPPEEELEALATTFNAMGEELGAARARLEKWNEDLQAEVDARTRELREAQARLVETQKLAAVGQLGAGVAHEINNPLAGVLGNVQLLLMKKRKAGAGDDDPEVKALAKVEESAKRCKDITGALLRFSQQQGDDLRRGALDLNGVVSEVARLSETGAAEQGVALETVPAAAPAQVVGDSAHLVQAVLHLVSNARTAVKDREGGRVRVEARVVDGEAQIRVADNGKGIDPKIRGRIFEPFFTTKDVWTNLGLGLSVAYRIAEDHDGRIEVESVPGQGTVMTLCLPRA